MCKSCRTCFKFYCMFYFTCDRPLRPICHVNVNSFIVIIIVIIRINNNNNNNNIFVNEHEKEKYFKNEM